MSPISPWAPSPAPRAPAGLQVWHDGRVVGHLRQIESSRNGEIVIRQIELEDLDPLAPTVHEPLLEMAKAPIREIRHQIVKRRAFIANHALETGNPGTLEAFMISYEIPADAVQAVDPERHRTTFTWNVVEVDLDEFEVLFDLDEFVPIAR